MSDWSPEAQAQSLKYAAWVSLITGVYFSILLVDKWLGYAGVNTGFFPQALMVLVAMLFIGVVSRLSVNNYKLCGGWREIFGVYSDEFTRETSRKANSRAFVGLLLVLIPGFLIGEKWSETTLGSYVTVSSFSLMLIVVGTSVWAASVLWEMREQGDAEHG
ncbi:hypothetical protein [Aliidiomarina celeris]|uniref:hypothetical protein n=1 Tax=Aliidiomarina celeris TaxID=2249428 RepID=UPI000DEA49F0|nr:hypothetical protein [Aliidiomarina celeris]